MPDRRPTIDSYRAGLPLRVARRVSRIALGMGATVVLSIQWAVASPFHRGPERSRAWRVACFQRWGRSLCRIGRLEIEIVGTPPSGPCVLVTNHVGYADILSLAAVLEAPAFVSMHEIRRWPLVGYMAAKMGTIFIDRTDKRSIPAVNATIGAALADARIIVLFAEGSNSDGSVVRPFRPPLLDPPARLGAPCAWATIRYAVDPGDPPPSRSVCWYEEPIHVQARRFLALDRIRARIEFGDGRVLANDRKELAVELHKRVLAQFTPME